MRKYCIVLIFAVLPCTVRGAYESDMLLKRFRVDYIMDRYIASMAVTLTNDAPVEADKNMDRYIASMAVTLTNDVPVEADENDVGMVFVVSTGGKWDPWEYLYRRMVSVKKPPPSIADENREGVIPGGEGLHRPITVKNGVPIDDMNLRRALFRMTSPSLREPMPGDPPRMETVADVADKYEVPSGRMAKTLEGIIRESLAWEKENAGSNSVFPWGYRCIPCLATFNSPESLELLRECVASAHTGVHLYVAETYIEIERAGAVPFLRELLANERLYRLNAQLYMSLGRYLGGNFHDDEQAAMAEKIHAFLVDMLEAEEDYYAANFLDILLCGTLEGYAASIQRERLVRRLLNLPSDWAYLRFNGMRDEIEKVPANERIDLRQRFPPTGLVVKKRYGAHEAPMDDTAINAAMMEGLAGCVIDGERFVGHILSLEHGRKIPNERLEKVVKDALREYLLQVKAGDGRTYQPYYIYPFISALKVFPNPDTLALLKEYMMSGDETIRRVSIMIYSAIAGAEAIPLLRKAVADGSIREWDYSTLYLNLERTVVKLRKNGKQASDMREINAFLMDMMQTEQETGTAFFLDGILCVTLDGYAKSIQRGQFIQRILDFPDDKDPLYGPSDAGSVAIHNRHRAERNQRLNEIKSGLEKIPADERIDLDRQPSCSRAYWAVGGACAVLIFCVISVTKSNRRRRQSIATNH